MNANQLLKELKSLGGEQCRKIYQKHGAGTNVYGVSFANLNKLKKQIKIDHPLALELWESGNMEAQTLALMIADPQQMDERTAEKWIGEITYHGLGNYMGGLLAKTAFAKKVMFAWMKSSKEYVKHCGYDICSTILKNNPDQISEKEVLEILKKIEKEIHSSPNRARNAMNWTIIAVGVFKPEMEKEVLEVAKRIGKVEVDHGDTSCKTPDAIEYIQKAKSHRSKKS